MQRLRSLLPGLVLTGVLTAISIELGRAAWFQTTGISALTLAIVLGMLVGNSFYPRIAAGSADGVGFSKQTLLRLGIILYGIRLTFQDIHVDYRKYPAMRVTWVRVAQYRALERIIWVSPPICPRVGLSSLAPCPAT